MLANNVKRTKPQAALRDILNSKAVLTLRREDPNKVVRNISEEMSSCTSISSQHLLPVVDLLKKMPPWDLSYQKLQLDQKLFLKSYFNLSAHSCVLKCLVVGYRLKWCVFLLLQSLGLPIGKDLYTQSVPFYDCE